MAQHTVWTSGYTFQAQFTGPGALVQVNNVPWSDIVGLKEGFGITYRAEDGKGNWFHVSIPTPTVSAGTKAKLNKVYALYAIDTWALLKAVDIYDGPKLVKRINGLSFTGNHSGGIDLQNTFDASVNDITFGIGISLLMECAPGLDANISFTGAGAEFDL
jgi:hypothetical protein